MDPAKHLTYWESIFHKFWKKNPLDTFSHFARDRGWISEVECNVKEMGEELVSQNPKLQENILQFAAVEDVRRVPLPHLFAIGCYHLRKDWVRFALRNDPAWKYLNTPHKRTEENFHSLNAWLDGTIESKVE